MTRTDFIRQVVAENEAELEILRTKGKAYSGEEDAFANFKNNAARLGLTKYQVWAVYAFKHIDAIQLAIKQDPNRPVEHSEGMKGRIRDAINYFRLIVGMLKEDNLLDPPVEVKVPNAKDLIEQIISIIDHEKNLTSTQAERMRNHMLRAIDTF